jgi:hypothetical protein
LDGHFFRWGVTRDHRERNCWGNRRLRLTRQVEPRCSHQRRLDGWQVIMKTNVSHDEQVSRGVRVRGEHGLNTPGAVASRSAVALAKGATHQRWYSADRRWAARRSGWWSDGGHPTTPRSRRRARGIFNVPGFVSGGAPAAADGWRYAHSEDKRRKGERKGSALPASHGCQMNQTRARSMRRILARVPSRQGAA